MSLTQDRTPEEAAPFNSYGQPFADIPRGPPTSWHEVPSPEFFSPGSPDDNPYDEGWNGSDGSRPPVDFNDVPRRGHSTIVQWTARIMTHAVEALLAGVPGLPAYIAKDIVRRAAVLQSMYNCRRYCSRGDCRHVLCYDDIFPYGGDMYRDHQDDVMRPVSVRNLLDIVYYQDVRSATLRIEGTIMPDWQVDSE